MNLFVILAFTGMSLHVITSQMPPQCLSVPKLLPETLDNISKDISNSMEKIYSDKFIIQSWHDTPDMSISDLTREATFSFGKTPIPERDFWIFHTSNVTASWNGIPCTARIFLISSCQNHSILFVPRRLNKFSIRASNG
jgi:hypothetical protein